MKVSMKITFITFLFCLLLILPASAEPLTETKLVILTENLIQAKHLKYLGLRTSFERIRSKSCNP